MTRFVHPIVSPLPTILLPLVFVLTLSSVNAGKPPGGTTPPPLTYQVTVVGQYVELNAINESGTCVGQAGGRAFIRHPDGTIEDLTGLAGTSEPGHEWTVLDYATEINETGQIAGRGFRLQNGTPAPRLFRYTPAGTETAGILENLYTDGGSGGSSYLRGLNDSGDVLIHRSMDSTSFYPETADSTDSAWIYSGDPGAGSPQKVLDFAVPHGINNWGQITGTIDTGSSSAAFVYSGPGALQTFGTLSGGTSSVYGIGDGKVINDRGDIGGWARVGKVSRKENTSFQAVVRMNGATAWDSMGITFSGNGTVWAMNNQGIPVGTSGGISALGFVYLNGKAWALKDLMLNAPTGIVYVNPMDVNDNGVICGSITVDTQSYFGVLLTPVPAP